MSEIQSQSGIGENLLHIYTRVSSDIQLEGESIQTQKREGIKKSKSLNIGYKIWDEGSSSSKDDDLVRRPVLQSLLNEVDKGVVKNLFVWNTDRLSRNQQVWGMIRFKLFSNKVQLHTPTQTIDLENMTDNLLLGILKEISVYDNMLRSERSRVGKLEKVKKGYWKGGTVTFGYRVEDKKLKIHKEESEIVNLMFDKVSGNKWTTMDCKKFLDKSIHTPRHGKGLWNTGTIRKMLTNPFYIGHYIYRDKKSGEEVKVNVPQIVDNVVFENVKGYFKKYESRKNQNNSTRNKYLLRDILVCECGTPMKGYIRKTKGLESQRYFCNHRMLVHRDGGIEGDMKYKRGLFCKNSKTINIKKTDKVVWESIKDVLEKSYGYREEFKKKIVGEIQKVREEDFDNDKGFQKKKNRLKREINNIVETLTTIEGDVLLGKFVGDSDKIKERVLKEKYELENKLDEMVKKHNEIVVDKKWIKWMDEFKVDMMNKENMKFEEKKEFIMNLVEKIVVSFNPESQDHNLEFHFKIPLVDDKRVKKDDKGFEIIDGDKIKEFRNLVLHGKLMEREKKSLN